MFNDAAQFLFRTLFDLAACAFFIRFWMQWARVPFHNPFAQFIVKVTDFAVKPLRGFLPGLFNIDWASLLPFFIAELLMVLSIHWLMGYPFAVAGIAVLPGFLLIALAAALRLMLYVLIGFKGVVFGNTFDFNLCEFLDIFNRDFALKQFFKRLQSFVDCFDDAFPSFAIFN